MVPEEGKAWSDNRRAQTVSYEQAQSGQYNWYLWKYQQCYELGTFFNSGPFAQTQQDHIEDCQATFGKPATYLNGKEWDVATLTRNISSPLVVVSGGKDPWMQLGVKPDHGFTNITYFYDAEGFHCPDRDDPKLGAKVYASLLGE